MTRMISAGLTLLAVIGAGCGPPASERSEDHPNILVFLVDTLRGDAILGTGITGTRSPTLDSLATLGVTFDHLVSPSPWTRPSVGSLFTSRYPTELGIDHGGHHGVMQVLPEEVPTLPQVLADAGYATAAIVANPHLKFWTRFDRGFDHFEFIDHRQEKRFRGRAEAVLDSLASDPRPFFLYVHLMDPHLPYRNHTSDDEEAPGAAGEYRPEVIRRSLLTSPDLPESLQRHILSLYEEEVRHADRWLGHMLGTLRASGEGNRTIVAVTSDHGEEHWDHGGAEHGHSLHVELLRVPGILVPSRSPDPTGFGEYCDSYNEGLHHEPLVRLLDLAPTLSSLAGIGPWPGGRGHDLVAALMGTAPPAPATSVGEALLYGPQYRSLRQGPWKLIRHPDGNRLYDIAEDPRELTDLLDPAVTTEAAQNTAAELSARLDSLVGTFEAPEQKSVQIDPETRKELEALGYLGP